MDAGDLMAGVPLRHPDLAPRALNGADRSLSNGGRPLRLLLVAALCSPLKV